MHVVDRSLCDGAGEDDEYADEPGGRGVLVQNGWPAEDAKGRFEATGIPSAVDVDRRNASIAMDDIDHAAADPVSRGGDRPWLGANGPRDAPWLDPEPLHRGLVCSGER